MKEEKSDQGKSKRSAEDWVVIARHFGEECLNIQRDSNLTVDQQLEKQKALSDKMIKEVESDTHLSEADKRQMVDSIHSYMHDWKTIQDLVNKEKSKKDASNQ